MYKFRNMYNTNQLVYVYVPEMENKKKKKKEGKRKIDYGFQSYC